MTLTIIKPAFSGLDLESKLKEYNHFLKEVLRGDVIDVDPIRKYFQGQGVDDFTISESFGKDLKKQSEEMTPPIPTYRQVQIDHTLLTSADSDLICSTIGGHVVYQDYADMLGDDYFQKELNIYEVYSNSFYTFEFEYSPTEHSSPMELLKAFNQAEKQILALSTNSPMFGFTMNATPWLIGGQEKVIIRIEKSPGTKSLRFFMNELEVHEWVGLVSSTDIKTFVFNQKDHIQFYKFEEKKEIQLKDSVIDYSK